MRACLLVQGFFLQLYKRQKRDQQHPWIKPSNVLLQELNPIPFPVVVANCVAWVAYSIVTKDPYVFLANDPGLILGLFYTFSAYGYADTKVCAL